MIKAKNKNSPLQALQALPYDEEAAKKYAESLKKLLPLLSEIQNVIKTMQTKIKALEALRQQVATRPKS